ncbi:hypothetical protein CVT24_002963 [Panaeolus cyanescens]|uniref:Uncharacterized protein n=1 Tax=Panaeolus cyanescens TaxID=181874 RepID=A0A409VPK8_9AGAR|nr:hypothetical protein CVT24_002963 [Panaeolus cyanescens]
MSTQEDMEPFTPLESNPFSHHVYVKPGNFFVDYKEDFVKFTTNPNLDKPLKTVTFFDAYDEEHSGLRMANVVFTVSTGYKFVCTVTYDSVEAMAQENRFEPFKENAIGMSVITFSGHDDKPLDTGFGPFLNIFSFCKELRITFRDLQWAWKSFMPFYRLPRDIFGGFNAGNKTIFDVMACSLQVAKFLDDNMVLGLKPGSTAEEILRQSIKRNVMGGEIMKAPCSDDEYYYIIESQLWRYLSSNPSF